MPSSLPKTKISVASGSSTASTSLLWIPKLETALLGSPYDPNPLLQLIALSRHQSPEIVHKAIWALHRVFISYIDQGRVGGLAGGDSNDPSSEGSKGNTETSIEGQEAREVRGWVRERLLEYVEILGGLLRDSEAGLRSSSPSLIFSLLGPLSVSASPPPNPAIIHTQYFRIIIRYLLTPNPSLRGAIASTASSSENSQKWTIVESNQIPLAAGILPTDVAKNVAEEFWAKYDDLRWAFYKETTRFLQTSSPLLHPENLLSLLTPLTNLPKLPEDLNTFFIPSLSVPPKNTNQTNKKAKLSKPKKPKMGKISGENDATPDWMAYYDSDTSESDQEDLAKGKKRALPGSTGGIRTSHLSVHASIHSLASHIGLYTTLWETVLSNIKLDEGWSKKVLVGLHGEKGILGNMRAERRIRVADWLGGLVDGGGGLAMLAMNGLFVLMTKYNLDYPNFYVRLYGLLDRNVLHVKYRARFFRLLDTFLASTLLPAALVASFIKRLSRLALTAPPAGIIMLIPFIYNLFKRHPGCMVMIQRNEIDNEESEIDPYNPDEKSPLATKAINSSCWELAALQHHYLASVSTLAKIFTEVFTKPEYNLEDFLDHGYGTLFEAETTRKIKNPPALSISIEHPSDSMTTIFPGENVEEEVRANSDLVSQLWTF